MQPQAERYRMDEIRPEVQRVQDKPERTVRVGNVTSMDHAAGRRGIYPDNPRRVEPATHRPE